MTITRRLPKIGDFEPLGSVQSQRIRFGVASDSDDPAKVVSSTDSGDQLLLSIEADTDNPVLIMDAYFNVTDSFTVDTAGTALGATIGDTDVDGWITDTLLAPDTPGVKVKAISQIYTSSAAINLQPAAAIVTGEMEMWITYIRGITSRG